jgi:hypothetical protein
MPSSKGAPAASSTPSSASPSRAPVMRLRCTSSPPSIAPHDWCATLAAL